MNTKNFVQWFFLLLGLLLFGLLLYKYDIYTIIYQILNIKFMWFIVLCIYTFLWRYLHAIAFYVLCGISTTKQGAFIITQIYSNTVSDIFMVGNMGGEVFRAYKLSLYYPEHKDRFISCTILYNIFYAIAMLFVFLTSAIWIVCVWDVPIILTYFFLAGFLGFAFIIFVLIFLRSYGLIKVFLTLFYYSIPIKTFQQYIKSLMIRVEPIDKTVHLYTSDYPWRVFIFTLLMFLSRMLTIVEPILIALALHFVMPVDQAVLLNMVDSFIRIAFFIIPNGQIGVVEGIMVSLSSVIEYSAATLLSISLLQRAKTIVWSFIGLSLMGLEKLTGSFYGKK